MQFQRISVLSATFFLMHFISNTSTENSLSWSPQHSNDVSQSDCITPRGRDGSCVLVTRCKILRKIRNYMKILEKSICDFEGNIPKVCCPHTVQQRTTPPSSSPSLASRNSTWRPRVSRRPLGAELPQRPSVEQRDRKTSSTTERNAITTTQSSQVGKTSHEKDQNNSRPFIPKGCGISMVTFRRIVRGKEALIGEWPWMAAIFIKRRGTQKNAADCGGTLVTSKHVLTAAHCVYSGRRNAKLDPKKLSVRLGDHDLMTDKDGVTPVNVNVKSVILHDKFDFGTFQNDIALLELNSTVKFIHNVAPICLPFNIGLEGDDTLSNKKAFAAGWGRVDYGGQESSKLLDVQLKIWKNKDCKKRFGKEAMITSVNLCAGYGFKDTCTGDSGGPLMLQCNHGKFYIVGIVSFGKMCAEPGYPGVYTRVTSYLDWIEEKIKATT